MKELSNIMKIDRGKSRAIYKVIYRAPVEVRVVVKIASLYFCYPKTYTSRQIASQLCNL